MLRNYTCRTFWHPNTAWFTWLAWSRATCTSTFTSTTMTSLTIHGKTLASGWWRWHMLFAYLSQLQSASQEFNKLWAPTLQMLFPMLIYRKSWCLLRCSYTLHLLYMSNKRASNTLIIVTDLLNFHPNFKRKWWYGNFTRSSYFMATFSRLFYF